MFGRGRLPGGHHNIPETTDKVTTGKRARRNPPPASGPGRTGCRRRIPGGRPVQPKLDCVSSSARTAKPWRSSSARKAGALMAPAETTAAAARGSPGEAAPALIHIGHQKRPVRSQDAGRPSATAESGSVVRDRTHSQTARSWEESSNGRRSRPAGHKAGRRRGRGQSGGSPGGFAQ